MNRRGIYVRRMLIFTGLTLLLFLIMQPLSILQFKDKIDVLFPKGLIGLEQRNLLFIIQAIMLFIMIPVFIFTFIFSWKYRHTNPKGDYDPELVDNWIAEIFWWSIPLVLTAIIGVLTWVKTHELDPYKPIESDKKPLTIQVVALQYRWLFIYPKEKVATLNYIQIPKDTPIHFEITSDAPMNSFWIPALGGQIYAMSKMKTELYLIANEVGEFRGSSANISGEGFADMHFITKATELDEYEKWLENAKKSENSIDKNIYIEIAKPNTDNTPVTYQLKDDSLFDSILMKYMAPSKHRAHIE